MDKDPYKVLGVSSSASKEEIHKAFRALASKYHPDRNPEDTESASVKFKEVSAAFEIVGDESRRRQYDLYREGGFSGFSFRSRNSVDDIFNNMFSQFFGDQRPSGSRVRIKISLEEAYFGCSKKVEVENHEFCEGCKGTGSSSWDPCGRCGGKGFFSVTQGSFSNRSSCMSCGGKGSIPKENCSSCSGRGHLVSGSREIEVSVPAGIENGSQIRIPNEGKDIFVYVVVETHSKFERHGHFLLARAFVPYSKLVFGGSEEVDIFGSKISVKIPPRSIPGMKMKIKGKGMPLPQNPNLRGDFVLELRLKIPKSLTKEHEELLRNLMKIESQD